MSYKKQYMVSHSPFISDGESLFTRSSSIMFAALFALIPGILAYGVPALGVVSLSVSTAVFWEFLMNRLCHREIAIGDGHAALTGLIFAMMMPAVMPWWAVVTGTFVAVVMGRMIFGGTGGNPFNPAVVGAAVLLVSWPHLLDFTGALADYDMGFNMVEPLFAAKYFGAAMTDNYTLWGLFLGHQAGGIGSVSGIGLVAGGFFLMLRGISRWEISLSFLAGVFVSAWLFHLANPEMTAGPLFHLLSGYTLLGAFFLATEDSSSPVNSIPMILYGLGGGCLTVLIRNKGFFVDGVLFAVLLMNLAAPLLDKIRPQVMERGV